MPEWVNDLDPKTDLPVGVDKGWGMSLEAGLSNAALIQHLARQADKFPEPLRTMAMTDLISSAMKRTEFEENFEGKRPGLAELGDVPIITLSGDALARSP